MESLVFGTVSIPSQGLVESCLSEFSEFSFTGKANVWCLHAETDEDRCFYYSSTLRKYFAPDLCAEYDIHPIVTLINSIESGFCVGDTFKVNGISFFIVDTWFAIATDSIGSFAWNIVDEWAHGPCRFSGSELKKTVEDWFEYFIKGSIVTKDVTEAISPKGKVSVFDVYDIKPMPAHPGRFHIVNKKGVVRHNARGHGFTSKEKARNMLIGYASMQPIPQDDIDAFYSLDELLDSTIPY